MNRPGGIPPIFLIVGALGAGIGGFIWLRKRNSTGGTASPATAGKTGQPAFSQAQEVQDFQVFSSLTSAQQGSDLNFLTEVAGLLGGGSSTGTTNTPATGVSSPPATGTAPPATIPASAVAAPATPPQNEPGYGAGAGQFFTNNPGAAGAPGVAGYQGSFNGVPL